jgi:hypothetical protein
MHQGKISLDKQSIFAQWKKNNKTLLSYAITADEDPNSVKWKEEKVQSQKVESNQRPPDLTAGMLPLVPPGSPPLWPVT